MISVDFPNLGQQVRWYRHGDGSIWPSTAYEYCQTSCICLRWMWESFRVVLETKPLHIGMFYNLDLASTKDLGCIPKSGPTSVVVTTWWSYEHCQTSCIVCLRWMGKPILVGLETKPLHIGMVYNLGSTQDFSQIHKSRPISSVAKTWWWRRLTIHSIWTLSKKLHMLEVGVETIHGGSGASTNAHWYGL